MLVPYCWLPCWLGCYFKRKSLRPGISPRRMAIPSVPPKKGMRLGVWRTDADVQASLAIHCRPVMFCLTTYLVEHNTFFEMLGECILQVIAHKKRKVNTRSTI